MKIIDGDSKLRVGTTLINEIFNNLIPTFELQLAWKYDPTRADFANEVWLVSRKLDGVRCIIMIDNDGNITFFSKAGNEFKTLAVLEAELKLLNLRNVVLDGEVCLIDEAGKEDFAGIMKVIGKKDYTIENPRYVAFDILSLDDFNRRTSDHILSQRYSNLVHFMFAHKFKLKHFEALEHDQISSEEEFATWKAKSAKEG